MLPGSSLVLLKEQGPCMEQYFYIYSTTGCSYKCMLILRLHIGCLSFSWVSGLEYVGINLPPPGTICQDLSKRLFYGSVHFITPLPSPHPTSPYGGCFTSYGGPRMGICCPMLSGCMVSQDGHMLSHVEWVCGAQGVCVVPQDGSILSHVEWVCGAQGVWYPRMAICCPMLSVMPKVCGVSGLAYATPC